MAQKKTFTTLTYLASILFLPWWVSLSFNKNMESWVTNWWNTRQPEMFLNDIKENNLLEKFIELEELLFLEEIIKEYPETHIKKPRIEIHKEMIQLVKMHNEGHIHSIFHFSRNIIVFIILSGYSILEFLYNLSDTIKAFSILLLTDLCIGFHSPHGWELMIGSISKDIGFDHNDQIISGLVSTFPVILDTLLKYWIFRYLNRVSPSLVGYKNPREATGRIVCANCHLDNKHVDIEVPQEILPDTVFEEVIRIPYDMKLKQVLANDPAIKKDVHFLKYPIYVGGNRGRGQIYPDGSKSNNTIYNATSASIVSKIVRKEKGGYEISIVDTSDGHQVVDIIPPRPELLVSEGESIKLDHPLTSNPNVGEFGQGYTYIVLQDPSRVQGLLFFLASVILAQIFLVLKKKQFEKVQLSEMNF
ncbi:hypothetical protein MKX03_025889 [Papaver bracteatum]|nr:hypothetical protein MKX03_025889 [Papaver bracteatum]